MSQATRPHYDFAVIGGGIVGASTAWQLQQRFPERKVVLVDKESRPASHQTGHNSGVIHAGVYYAPGSLKAQFCREGSAATLAFCDEHGIPVERCGKLLVATNDQEFERMKALYARCEENGITVDWIDAVGLQQLEPHIRGLGALRVPATAIVDYRLVTGRMLELFRQLGGEVRLSSEVVAIDEAPEQITVTTRAGQFTAGYLVACAGLMADRIARMAGLTIDFSIVPFRGEYYRLPARHNGIVSHLIYPIPDPALPFLGVHLTRMIDGSVTVGPNAVQGWRREGYGRFNFSLRDTLEMLIFPGTWRLLRRHYATGLAELRDSLWKRGYLRRVRKYCRELTLADLQPCPAGIRAQAVLRDGSLVHDFLFAESPRSLHVCNAPSPAATSAIPIGAHLVDKVIASIA